MYRNKLSSRHVNVARKNLRFIAGLVKCFKLSLRQKVAFDSSKLIRFNLIHWLGDLTNRKKPNLGKKCFRNFPGNDDGENSRSLFLPLYTSSV